MAVLKVLAWPDPFLRRTAAPVTEFNEALREVVADMEETMEARNGLGLAATQVGLNLRLVVVDPYAFDKTSSPDAPRVVLINPEVVWESDETITGEEGCLSFPSVYIQVERPVDVKVRALNLDGEHFEIEGHGLGARALIHELEHLDGGVMIDRVSSFIKRRALKKHERNQQLKVRDEEEKLAEARGGDRPKRGGASKAKAKRKKRSR